MAATSQQLQIIQTKIEGKSNTYMNIRNAVKILQVYSNWNGHTKLYTEVESNFVAGDTVYITYTEPIVPSDVFNLENPLSPYAEYSLGYKIVSVNNAKNEIVINRDYIDIPTGKILKNQYLSKASCRGGRYYSGNADGAVFYNCDIYSGLTITQGVLKYCDLYGITFNEKYSDTQTIVTSDSFNSKFNVKSQTTTTYQSNNSYYNRIESCNLIDCNVLNGMFSGCTITGTTGDNYINNGYFYNCNISGYTINNGHFYNCKINSNNTWNYGYWDNTNGTGIDFNANWHDGVWNRGDFSSPQIWSGGTFNNGTFSNTVWVNGIVNNGTFSNSTWYNGLVRNGRFTANTIWHGGTFNKGIFNNSIFSGGTFNNGNMYSSTIYGGSLDGGVISGSTFYNGRIKGASLWGTTLYGGKIYSTPNAYYLTAPLNSTISLYGGNIKQSNFFDGDIFNGQFDGCTGNANLKIYNGNFSNCKFTGTTIQNGIFNKCISKSLNFYYGIYTEGFMYNSVWYDGYWNDGTFSGTTMGAGLTHWYDGHFYGGVFWGDVAPAGINSSWHGGYFHYGVKNGTNIIRPGGIVKVWANIILPEGNKGL